MNGELFLHLLLKSVTICMLFSGLCMAVFPSHSYWFFYRSLTFLCTRNWVRLYGIKEVGGLAGSSFVEKSGISQLFMVICFPHLLALNLAFEKSRIILHLIDT